MDAGQHFGVIGSAAASTQATNTKNVAILGTLTNALPTTPNSSFAGYFDGGTLPDSSSRALYVTGTGATSGSVVTVAAGTIGQNASIMTITGTANTTGTSEGVSITNTSAGSAASFQRAFVAQLSAGYTGSVFTFGGSLTNGAAGTGTTLGLQTAGLTNQNYGATLQASGTGAGNNVGSLSEGGSSTGTNVGSFGKALSAAAGTNIGMLGSAANSTEATNLKNIAGWFTLDTTSPAAIADNTSVALAAAGDGTSDIFRGYDAATLMFRMEDSGEFTSAGTTSIGWSVVAGANTACNTTCTSACVVGFAADVSGSNPVGCADATADSCACAGPS